MYYNNMSYNIKKYKDRKRKRMGANIFTVNIL